LYPLTFGAQNLVFTAKMKQEPVMAKKEKDVE